MSDEKIRRTVRVRWARHNSAVDPTPIAAERWREDVCVLAGEAATEKNVAAVVVQEDIWRMLAIRFLGDVKHERFVVIDTIEPVCNCMPRGACKYEDKTRFSIDPETDNNGHWDSLRDEETGGYIAAGIPEAMELLLPLMRRRHSHQ